MKMKKITYIIPLYMFVWLSFNTYATSDTNRLTNIFNNNSCSTSSTTFSDSCSCIDAAFDCAFGTAIHALPYTINAPGVYYVCDSFTYSGAVPAITIASSDVTLNLNDNTIHALGSPAQVIDVTNMSNVAIKNGTIIPNVEAIRVDTSFDVRIHNIVVKNAADSAIVLSNSDKIVAEQCTMYGWNGNSTSFFINPGHIMVTGNTSNVYVHNCKSYFPFFRSYSVDTTGTGTIIFEHCTSEAAVSFSVQGVGTSLVTLKNCIAHGQQLGFDNGFVVMTDISGINHTVIFDSCTAVNFGGEGFTLPDSGPSLGTITPVTYINCYASTNRTGFAIASQGRKPLLVDCTSSNNTFTGFTAGAQNVNFEHCIATENGTHGFDIQQLLSNQATLRDCVASKNSADGFFLVSGATSFITLKDSLATSNTNFGIDVFGFNVTIFDTRSAGNGAGDNFGAATVITY